MERAGCSYHDLVHGLLRSVWDEPRPVGPPRRGWRDWALVGVLVPVAVLEGLLRPDVPWRPVAVLVALGLLPALLWRRSRPLLMVVIVFVTAGLVPVLTRGDPPELYVMVFLLLFPYSLARWGSGREIAIGSAIVVAKVCVWAVVDFTGVADAVGELAVLSAAAAVGAAFRFRARARTREFDQVKLLERERLARELHDSVGHHVSAMAIRAQAGLATSGTHPDAATDALRIIEAEASRALAEMRAMVRVLRRDQPADLAPSPHIGDLHHLATPGEPRLRPAGLDGPSDRTQGFRGGPSVDVEIIGDLGDLPPSISAALYRLAQESVTNARRHARHATRIAVRVAADDTSVHLQVTDDGDTSLLRPNGTPGYGVIGMIERADLLGGTCQVGPNPDQGWTVTAVLPRVGPST
jgi:signal transduction histidine kinase